MNVQKWVGDRACLENYAASQHVNRGYRYVLVCATIIRHSHTSQESEMITKFGVIAFAIWISYLMFVYWAIMNGVS